MTLRRLEPRPGRLRRWAAALLAGGALGLLTAEIMIQGAGPAVPAPVGPWRLIQPPAAGFYQEAQTARASFLPLPGDQYVRFEAGTDSEGRGLDGRCLYAISGPFPEAQAWSLEAAGFEPPPPPLDPGDLPGNLLLSGDAAEHQGVLKVGPAGDGRRLITWPTATGAKLILRLYGPAVGAGGALDLPMISGRECPSGGRP